MTEIFKAVHYAEVTELFRSLGLEMDLLKGNLSCVICDDVISATNFGAITRKSGNIIMACDKESCYSAFIYKLARE